MTIKDVRLQETRTTVSLVATCKIRRVGTDTVRFTFSKKLKPMIAADASPFAAALLLPSMRQGEDLIIEGSVSQKLLDGMHRIMDTVLGWDIGLKRIAIKPAAVSRDVDEPQYTGTFFSGGVDSFYTYLKHKKDKEPITHLILVNGYDIDYFNKDLWDATQKNIRDIAAEEKVKLIEAESNLRPLIEPILPWDYTHGGCLAAVGLALRGGFKHVYIPSSYTVEQQFPWGTHLKLDHHWGTETLTFTHDGTEASRVNKVVWQVAASPSALKHLRVCYMNTQGEYNCGVCDKCLRTMINLKIAGALDKARTFPHTIDLKRVAQVKIDGEHGAIFHKENLAALKERNMLPDLQAALKKSLANVVEEPTPLLRHRVLKHIVHYDHLYTRGKAYKFLVARAGRRLL